MSQEFLQSVIFFVTVVVLEASSSFVVFLYRQFIALYESGSPKVTKIYEESSVKGRSPCTHSSGRMGNAVDSQRKRGLNEPRDKDSSSTKCQRLSWRADDLVEPRETSCP